MQMPKIKREGKDERENTKNKGRKRVIKKVVINYEGQNELQGLKWMDYEG
jgi:hypothetical protein